LELGREGHAVVEVPQSFCEPFLDARDSTVALIVGGYNTDLPNAPYNTETVELFGCPEDSPGGRLPIANYPTRCTGRT